jgi:hypothetical protein
MESTVRTVQRAIAKLESEQLLIRQVGPKRVPVLDPEPLVQRLSDLAKSDPDYLIRTGGFVA